MDKWIEANEKATELLRLFGGNPERTGDFTFVLGVHQVELHAQTINDARKVEEVRFVIDRHHYPCDVCGERAVVLSARTRLCAEHHQEKKLSPDG